MLALVYIDRLIQRNDLVLSTLNVHRIIITRWAAVTRAAAVCSACNRPLQSCRYSVMLAAKFFDDQYFNNAYYAKVGARRVWRRRARQVVVWGRLSLAAD